MLIIEARHKDPMVVMHHVKDELSKYQEIVGGYVEAIKLDEQHVMLVNEDGMILNLPINRLARQILVQARFPNDGVVPILGNVVIIGVDGPDFTDIGQKALDYTFYALERVGM